jgi:hypothetical protein
VLPGLAEVRAARGAEAHVANPYQGCGCGYGLYSCIRYESAFPVADGNPPQLNAGQAVSAECVRDQRSIHGQRLKHKDFDIGRLSFDQPSVEADIRAHLPEGSYRQHSQASLEDRLGVRLLRAGRRISQSVGYQKTTYQEIHFRYPQKDRKIESRDRPSSEREFAQIEQRVERFPDASKRIAHGVGTFACIKSIRNGA